MGLSTSRTHHQNTQDHEESFEVVYQAPNRKTLVKGLDELKIMRLQNFYLDEVFENNDGVFCHSSEECSTKSRIMDGITCRFYSEWLIIDTFSERLYQQHQIVEDHIIVEQQTSILRNQCMQHTGPLQFEPTLINDNDNLEEEISDFYMNVGHRPSQVSACSWASDPCNSKLSSSLSTDLSQSMTSSSCKAPCDDSAPIRIQTYLKYNPNDWILTAGVKQMECPMHSNCKKEKMHWMVHVTLLPFCKQRYKTNCQNTSTPIFNQLFEFEEVPKHALPQMSLRYRLYKCLKGVRGKRLVAELEDRLEKLLYTKDHILDGEWYTMEKLAPRRSRFQRRGSLPIQKIDPKRESSSRRASLM